MGDEGRLPPKLDGVGGKLTEKWLKQLLNEGSKDRQYMLTKMPRFGANNIGHLATPLYELDKLPQIEAMKGRDFYAVGGTWRALATLHQHQVHYPLNVMHGYTLPAKDVADFVKLVEKADLTGLDAIDAVSSARRPLLAYGALVLDELIKRGKPRAVIISAQGVREGLLHEQLSDEERAADPLLRAARDYNHLRARDPRHVGTLRHACDRTGRSHRPCRTDHGCRSGARPRPRARPFGTGSGAIAIALAARCPRATTATPRRTPSATGTATATSDRKSVV